MTLAETRPQLETDDDKELRCWRCTRRLPIDRVPTEEIVITCPRCGAKKRYPEPK